MKRHSNNTHPEEKEGCVREDHFPELSSAQQLSSEVPAYTYTSLMTGPDNSSSSSQRGENDPTVLLGKSSLLTGQTPVH